MVFSGADGLSSFIYFFIQNAAEALGLIFTIPVYLLTTRFTAYTDLSPGVYKNQLNIFIAQITRPSLNKPKQSMAIT